MSSPVVQQEYFLDYLFSSVYTCYSILGIILNLFVLWLIVSHKHDCIKEYRILLGNTTCTLLLLSLLTFFLQLRFVVAGDTLGYVALGPARFLNMPRLMLFCTALVLVIDIYSFMTIAMCMAYKYCTIAGHSPSERRLLVGIGLFFLIPLSTGIAVLAYEPDFSELHSIQEQLRPELQLWRYGNYSGLPDVKSIYVMYLIIVICMIGAASYAVMVAAGLGIRRSVMTNNANMSSKNAKVFKMMVKALIIQSFMPVFFSFPTKLLYFAVQFGAFHSLTAEYMMFAMSPLVAIFDPCITLYYVLPYRRYLKKKLGFLGTLFGRTAEVNSTASTARKSTDRLSTLSTITDISHHP